MSENAIELTLSQQFELTKMKHLIERASIEQMQELYIELLKHHYLFANASKVLLAADFKGFTQ